MVAATTAGPGAVAVSEGAGAGVAMGGGSGVVWVVLSCCRNVGGSATYCWGVTWFCGWTEACGTSEICCMKAGGCVVLTFAVMEAGVEVWEEEL